jgi:hypothetical protein
MYPKKGNRLAAMTFSISMDSLDLTEKGTNSQTGLQHELTPQIEFWRGIVLGTVAGMVIAVWSYSLFDRAPKFLQR